MWLMDYGPRLGQCGEKPPRQELPRLRERNFLFPGALSTVAKCFLVKRTMMGAR